MPGCDTGSYLGYGPWAMGQWAMGCGLWGRGARSVTPARS